MQKQAIRRYTAYALCHAVVLLLTLAVTYYGRYIKLSYLHGYWADPKQAIWLNHKLYLTITFLVYLIVVAILYRSHRKIEIHRFYIVDLLFIGIYLWLLCKDLIVTAVIGTLFTPGYALIGICCCSIAYECGRHAQHKEDSK